MRIPRLIITGSTSGVGKTSITSAIIYGLKNLIFILESEFTTIFFSTVLSLGGIWARISGFESDDDDDQDGGGLGTPVFAPSLSGSTA